MAETPKPRKPKNPQDATRKHDVDPLRRRIEVLERHVAALEAWASTLVNPDTPMASHKVPANE